MTPQRTANAPAVEDRIVGILDRCRPGELDDRTFSELLHALCQLVQAERAFLIALEGKTAHVLWSATIDGDPVPQADHRIDPELLLAAKAAPGELLIQDDRKLPPQLKQLLLAGGRKGALLYRLMTGEEETAKRHCYLFMENRFCPLTVPQEAPALFALLAAVLRLSLWAKSLKEKLARRESELRKAEALLVEARAAHSPVQPHCPARPKQAKAARRFKGDYSAIVTCSPRMYAIFSVIDKVAHTSAPVLITGESGTGKELVARAIHENSPRAGKPFVPENCAALTETLLESELFGYVKGAFTGATSSRKGLFELANGGTLFLDEVGEMSLGMQKKLLRVLQEGVIRPVGGKDFIPVDVRIISATNRDLAAACREKTFREDLLYRLNVITLELPPLRERSEDIPLLVEHFLRQLAGPDKPPKRVSPQAMAILKSYSWPGNVRQLQNEIQRLHTLGGEVITPEDLSPAIRQKTDPGEKLSLADLQRLPLKQALETFEREYLRRALRRFEGNKTRVARELGIPKTSLYSKLQRYGLL